MQMTACETSCKTQFSPSYEILQSLTENCKEELLTNLVYQFLIETDIDKLIATILSDIKSSDNQLDLSSDALILIVISLNCIKDLYTKVFDIYLNKQLSYSKNCVNVNRECNLSYHDIVIKFESLIKKYNIKFNNEITKTYYNFISNVLLKKYYGKCLEKLDELHMNLEISNFSDEKVNLFMKTLQIFFYTLIVSNVWFIVEMNHYFKNNKKEVVFYINSRFYNFYFNKDYKLDYVDNFIKYVIDLFKIKKVKLYNLLNVGLVTYYPLLKDKIKDCFEKYKINIQIEDIHCIK